MRTHSIRIFSVAAATLAIASTPAMAQRSVMQVIRDDPRVQTSTNRDIERQRELERERQRQREIEIARSRNEDRIYRDRDRDRDGDWDRDRDHDGDRKWKKGKKVPPGLAKKPGQMPPGQYKKRYGTQQGASVLGDIMRRDGYSVLRTIPRDGAQYVYYRTRDGSERRAIVSEGRDRLSFSNVPQSVLQQVMSALYR
jgi:hypothetical protein